MAVNNLNFAAQIDAWTAKTEARMLAVFHQATQRTTEIAQANIPVDTGFARASIRASLSSMPPIDPAMKRPARGTAFAFASGDLSVTIADAQLGETVYIGWTANYVGFLENGTSKMAPRGFVKLAAMQWPQTVSETIQQARSGIGG